MTHVAAKFHIRVRRKEERNSQASSVICALLWSRDFWWHLFIYKTTDFLSLMLVMRGRYGKTLPIFLYAHMPSSGAGRYVWRQDTAFTELPVTGICIALTQSSFLGWGHFIHQPWHCLKACSVCSLQKCSLATHFQAAAWDHGRALRYELEEMLLGVISVATCIYCPVFMWFTIF